MNLFLNPIAIRPYDSLIVVTLILTVDQYEDYD